MKDFTYLGDGLWVKADATGLEIRVDGNVRPLHFSLSAFRRLLRLGIKTVGAGHADPIEPPTTPIQRTIPLMQCAADRDDEMVRWEETLRRKARERERPAASSPTVRRETPLEELA